MLMKMRPTMSVLSTLLLLLLTSIRQGISLEENYSMKAFFKKTNEEEKSMLGGSTGGVSHCDHAELCKGRSRKLMNKTLAPSKAMKDASKHFGEAQMHQTTKKGIKDRANFIVDKHLKAETYPDILDISGMDYSPARRKPPIHN